MKEENFYKTIIKSTGLFGTSQLLQIFFQVVANKFIAVLLGVSGVGMVGMFNNVLQLITSLVGFDLQKVSTRSIALVHENKNYNLSKTLGLLNFMAIFIGVIGALVSISFAGFWSRLAFSDTSYKHWFYFLGVYFFFWAFVQTRMGILQGTQQLKTFAFFQVFSAVSLGSISVLFYYLYGIEAIILVTIIGVFVQLIFLTWITKTHQLNFKNLAKNWSVKFSEALPIYQLGLVLSINAVIGQLCFLGVRYFLKQQPDAFSLVGFYEVNQTVMLKYLGLIFVAMNYYFYPKLTALIDDLKQSTQLLMNQIQSSVLLITPAIVLLFVLDEWFIKLLYTEKFVFAFRILQFSLLGLFLRGITNALGFFALAKGNKKLFFKQELLGDLLNLFFSVLGFYWFGLAGLGMGIALMYFVYGVFVTYQLQKTYGVWLDQKTIQLILINGGICLLASFISFWSYNFWVLLILFLFITLKNSKALYQRFYG